MGNSGLGHILTVVGPKDLLSALCSQVNGGLLVPVLARSYLIALGRLVAARVGLSYLR